MFTLAMDMIKTASAETINQLRPEIRAAGKFEGIKEGMAEVFMDQLKTRFDRLPSWVPDRVASAESEEIVEWAIANRTADSVEDVFQARSNGAKRGERAGGERSESPESP